MPRARVAKGVALLLLACVLWGASFPVIKLVMGFVSVYTYLWVRSSIALALLSIIALPRIARRGVSTRCLVGGLAAGACYVAGLGLQAIGTYLTEASRAAFLTGLAMVFVHAYSSLVEKRYSRELAASLALSLAGLYLMTRPSGGVSIGDALVIASAVAWAAQIIVVSKYSSCDPLTFVLLENAPAIAIALPLDLALGGPRGLSMEALEGLAFLGIACSVIAFALQVVGQRSVDPATAAVIYQSEPVFAAVIAYLLLGEVMDAASYVGASLILAAATIAALSSARPRSTSSRSTRLRR